jgi:hypothetical protein
MERLTKQELRALFEFIKECYSIYDIENFCSALFRRCQKLSPRRSSGTRDQITVNLRLMLNGRLAKSEPNSDFTASRNNPVTVLIVRLVIGHAACSFPPE